MIKRLLTLTAAAALLLGTTAPSFAAWRGGGSWHWHGGSWHGHVWHGGGWVWGPAVGAAVGLGVLGAAIASAPYYYGYPY